MLGWDLYAMSNLNSVISLQSVAENQGCSPVNQSANQDQSIVCFLEVSETKVCLLSLWTLMNIKIFGSISFRNLLSFQKPKLK